MLGFGGGGLWGERLEGRISSYQYKTLVMTSSSCQFGMTITPAGPFQKHFKVLLSSMYRYDAKFIQFVSLTETVSLKRTKKAKHKPEMKSKS